MSASARTTRTDAADRKRIERRDMEQEPRDARAWRSAPTRQTGDEPGRASSSPLRQRTRRGWCVAWRLTPSAQRFRGRRSAAAWLMTPKTPTAPIITALSENAAEQDEQEAALAKALVQQRRRAWRCARCRRGGRGRTCVRVTAGASGPRIDAGAHDERERGQRHLRPRNEHAGLGLGVEPRMPGICHDADDQAFDRPAHQADPHRPADRVLAIEVAPDECLVDDHRRWARRGHRPSSSKYPAASAAGCLASRNTSARRRCRARSAPHRKHPPSRGESTSAVSPVISSAIGNAEPIAADCDPGNRRRRSITAGRTGGAWPRPDIRRRPTS